MSLKLNKKFKEAQANTLFGSTRTVCSRFLVFPLFSFVKNKVHPVIHHLPHVILRVHHLLPVRPLRRQPRLRRQHQRERLRVGYVPVEDVHLVHTQRPDQPQKILHGVVVPRRVEQHAAVAEHWRVGDPQAAGRHPRRRRVHQLGEGLEPAHRAPWGGRGQERWSPRAGDGEGVRLIDAVGKGGGERRRRGEVEGRGNQGAVGLIRDQIEVAEDGGGEVAVAGGAGDVEVVGEPDGLWIGPVGPCGLGPDVDRGFSTVKADFFNQLNQNSPEDEFKYGLFQETIKIVKIRKEILHYFIS
ncbi:elongation factor G [Striga asiatica]|uniref:Elongation factor G n=1 Tax=Striga asiatica TaxID=4170 RepID=A0A5A7RJN8_STRAF|nr:elongation factor G [Striga asiatica]